ncbi:MAG: hypothetical protein IPH16_11030 [Haliscomenobacter sp.]|nr:hypothetical protein [Haliscomenobacter sp.]
MDFTGFAGFSLATGVCTLSAFFAFDAFSIFGVFSAFGAFSTFVLEVFAPVAAAAFDLGPRFLGASAETGSSTETGAFGAAWIG